MARCIRLLDRSLTPDDSSFTLAAAPSHHLLKALRAQTGQPVEVFDGSGQFIRGTLSAQSSKRNAIIDVLERGARSLESPLLTTLCIAISKGDRFDYALQKATELGVSQIVPIVTERSEFRLKGERLQKKHASWQGIVDTASEQCGRFHSPIVSEVISISQLLESLVDDYDLRLVLHHRAATTLATTASPKSVLLLIGPEGGLSEAEISLAEQRAFQAVLFGPRVLRTETAPIVALTVLQQLYGDFD